jgi:hypothetical protein
MREFNWCDFGWDARTCHDPPAMLARLEARGLHICVWIKPYIAQRSPLFAEAERAGYLIKKPNGDMWQTDQWQAGPGVADFTHPAARQWFGDKLRVLLDMGVDCFKTDYGERIPTEVVYAVGADPARTHNYYSMLYNQTVFKVLRERRGTGQVVVFARSATAGGSASRCTGAATANRPSSRWGKACAAGCHSGCRALVSGAATSAASRVCRLQPFTSTGSPSASFRRTAGCTAAARTACHGSTAKR